MHITQQYYQRIYSMGTVRNYQIHPQWHADSNMILLMGVIIMALAFGRGEYFPKHQPWGSQLRLMPLEDLYIRAPDGLQQIRQACPVTEGDMPRHVLGDAKKFVVSLTDGIGMDTNLMPSCCVATYLSFTCAA